MILTESPSILAHSFMQPSLLSMSYASISGFPRCLIAICHGGNPFQHIFLDFTVDEVLASTTGISQAVAPTKKKISITPVILVDRWCCCINIHVYVYIWYIITIIIIILILISTLWHHGNFRVHPNATLPPQKKQALSRDHGGYITLNKALYVLGGSGIGAGYPWIPNGVGKLANDLGTKHVPFSGRSGIGVSIVSTYIICIIYIIHMQWTYDCTFVYVI